MYAQERKNKDNNSGRSAGSIAKKKVIKGKSIGFVDNRPESIARRKPQKIVDNNLKGSRDTLLQATTNLHSHSEVVIQNTKESHIEKPIVQRVIDESYLSKYIQPKLNKAKFISPDNTPFLDKMYSDIEEAVLSRDEREIIRSISTFNNFVSLLNVEKSKGESKWHPTGGKSTVLDEEISTGAVYLHFTNLDGFVSILQAGKIEDKSQLPGNRPGSSPGVYIVPGRQTFNPEEAHLNLFLGQDAYKDRGGFVFAFSLPENSVTDRVPLTAGSPYIEAKHIGDINISNAIYKGLNPFVTGHH